MSLVSYVFNKKVAQVLLALSIPSGIIYFFTYSQNQADIQLKEFQAQQKAHPKTQNFTIDNYSMKEVDDANRVRWQLKSDQGVLQPNGKDILLKTVTVEYYDQKTGEMKMRMSAPLGEANQQTKYVKLLGDKKTRVTADGGGMRKSHFECSQVELIKKDEFLASGGVIIDWPGVAKVSGSLASGSTDMSSGPKNLKVIGNTHAEIAVR